MKQQVLANANGQDRQASVKFVDLCHSLTNVQSHYGVFCRWENVRQRYSNKNVEIIVKYKMMLAIQAM